MTRRQRLAAALLAAAFAAFYAATTRGVLAFGDDVLAFQVTEAIVERGEVAVTSPSDRGSVARSIPGADGRGYSKYGLGTPVAAVPFYLAGRSAERRGFDLPETRDSEGNLRTGTRIFATGLVNALAGALTLFALVVLAAEAGFSFPVAFALGALLGGATFFAHSAATLLSEPLAAAALTAAAAAALRASNALRGPDGRYSLRSRGDDERERQRLSVEGGDETESERQRLSVEGRDQDETERARPTIDGSADRGSDGQRVSVESAIHWAVVRAVAASGALAGFAVLVKVAHVVAVVPLGLWLFWSLLRDAGHRGLDPGDRRRALGLALLWTSLVLVFVAAVAIYNQERFGSVWETGYGDEATRLTTAPWVGLAGLLISPGKGVLWYAPPLLLAVAGWGALARRRPEVAGLVAAVAAGPLLLASVYYQWHGGGSWGPRLLLPVLPVALLGAGEVLERARGRSRSALALSGVAAAAGGVVVALAVLVPFDRYHAEVWPDPEVPLPERFDAMLWSPPASPLAVHLRSLPGAAATTLRMLAGREPLPGPDDKGRPDLPDLAFARYGSHALLEWTRGALLLAALTGAAAVAAARRALPRAQKASLSSPPQ